MSSPTFSVCVIAREKPDVIARFVSYYHRLGAERVRVFFDGEADEVTIPNLPGLDLVFCDKVFWQERLGRQPLYFHETMQAVYRFAHDTSTSDWQMFFDADEFLVSDVPVAEILARVPEDCDALRILNREAVWGPGDELGAPFGCTYFRALLSPRKARVAQILVPRHLRGLVRQGVVGHRGGKHVLRRGAQVDEFNSHFSLRDGTAIGVWAHDIGFSVDSVFLAHFDAVSKERWIEKWRRRISEERPSATIGPQRRAQLEAVKKAAETGALQQLFLELYCISRPQALLLTAIGGLQRRRLFPVEDTE